MEFGTIRAGGVGGRIGTEVAVCVGPRLPPSDV